MREVYRILDANFNRAREAVRVAEDFARFALSDADLAGGFKNLRSMLQECYQRFPAPALLAARDTGGDVGTAITSPTEMRRADAASVAVAACKRLTEALRTLEEYAKLALAEEAPKLEAMRYQAYQLEQRLGRRLSAGERLANLRLYVLLTSRLCRRDVLETAGLAIEGGADAIQMREKDMPDRQRLELARRLRELTARAGVLFIVNDRADIAAAAGADGVHLGQDDLPPSAIRPLLPPRALIGLSTHTLEQAKAAAGAGADYIGVGPMFPTATKDAGPLAGPACLRAVLQEVSLPAVAIGGITADNIDQLVAAGAKAVAVSSAVIAAEDPAAAARAIREKLPAGEQA
jgi:thiamine-phosphate pyrophosphorylase